MVFAKTPPRYEAITFGVANMNFKIPPNDGNYEVKSRKKFGYDSHLLGVHAPHALARQGFSVQGDLPGRQERGVALGAGL